MAPPLLCGWEGALGLFFKKGKAPFVVTLYLTSKACVLFYKVQTLPLAKSSQKKSSINKKDSLNSRFFDIYRKTKPHLSMF